MIASAWLQPGCGQPPSNPQRPAVRQVLHGFGRPLASLLLPGERELNVWDGSSPPFVSGNGIASKRELEALTIEASAAIVIRVLAVTAVETPNYWVESRFDVEVEEVLKGEEPLHGLTAGGRLLFRLKGGELKVQGATIRAGKDWTTLPRIGRRYLYFLGEDHSGNREPFPESSAFELTRTDLRRLRPDSAPQEGERDMPVKTGLAIVRAASTLTSPQ